MPEDCPQNCPNRTARNPSGASVKIGSYLFALCCALFLGYQCWSHDRRGEVVSPIVWMPLLLLTGTALGVNVDPGAIASALSPGQK